MASTEEAQEFLSLFKSAYKAAIMGKNYSITMDGNTRTFNRQDIKEILEHMRFWESEVSRLSTNSKGLKTTFITPVI